MKNSSWKISLACLAAAGFAAPSVASAADPAGKVQSTFVRSALPSGAIEFPDDRNGKLKVKAGPSTKDGEGGYVTQIAGNAKLTCPPNDEKGVCGPKGSPVTAVAVQNWNVLGVIPVEVTQRILVEKCKIVFQSTGKNKANASTNASASVLYGTSVSFGFATLNNLGPDPDNPVSGCDGSPTLIGKTDCIGGEIAVAGFVWGIDSNPSCSTDAECVAGGSDTLICVGGNCEIQTCTDYTDCNSGSCNTTTGNCCDPATAVDPAQCDGPPPSPSGAFLDNAQF
jgi:hypothetical protein